MAHTMQHCATLRTSPHRLYTQQEVAAMFGVSRHVVHRWIRDGGLPALRISGSHIRIEGATLVAWLDENETAA